MTLLGGEVSDPIDEASTAFMPKGIGDAVGPDFALPVVTPASTAFMPKGIGDFAFASWQDESAHSASTAFMPKGIGDRNARCGGASLC